MIRFTAYTAIVLGTLMAGYGGWMRHEFERSLASPGHAKPTGHELHARDVVLGLGEFFAATGAVRNPAAVAERTWLVIAAMLGGGAVLFVFGVIVLLASGRRKTKLDFEYPHPPNP